MAGIHTPVRTTQTLNILRYERPHQNWRDTSNRGHACDSLIMAQNGNVCYLFLKYGEGYPNSHDIMANGTWYYSMSLEVALLKIDEICREERVIISGTLIKITRPFDDMNWAGGMNAYVGRRCIVHSLELRPEMENGNSQTRVKIEEDQGEWHWVLEHGHFMVVEWPRQIQVEPPVAIDFHGGWMQDYLREYTTLTAHWSVYQPMIPEWKEITKPKYPDPNPIVGDWVQITKSKTRWHKLMDDYVGQYFKISSIDRRSTYARCLFEDMPYDMQNLNWEFKSKHFKKVSKPKTIAKRPLVLSSSFKKFIESIYHESRLARILAIALNFDLLGNTGQRALASKIVTGEDVSYLTFRTDGTISYLPKGKQCVYTLDRKWANDGRQSGKPAKVLRKVFTHNALRLFKEADFEIFNNKYKARFSTEGFKFEVLPNNEIDNVYNTLRVDRADGDCTLNGSCMNIDYDSERPTDGYFEIYTKCPKASIIKLTDKEGKLSGRALLWKATRLDNGEEIMFMDRVYVVKDHLYDAFIEFADDNKYWHKKYYKSREFTYNLIDPSGEEQIVKLEIKTNTDCESYPYIDTFSWGDDGVMRNYEEQNNRYIYDSTTGGRDDNDSPEVWDEINEEDIHERNSVEVTVGQYRDCTTHIDNTITISGRVYWREDELITYSDYYEEYITKAGSVWISDLDTMVKEADATQITAGARKGEWIILRDACKIDGEVYHMSDEVVTKQ